MVLKNLGVKRAMVVHGMDGLDEITITTKTYAAELKDDQTIIEYTIDPKEYGISYADKDSIIGGDSDLNAEIMTRLFSGERGPKRDMLLLNAAAALYVAGKALSIKDGLGIASKLIDDGSVKGKLEEYRKFVKECVGSA
jgi:anthranilate phosphoribosyltransferase